jgi:transcriptional regulator GlxA family with amidase domain
MDRRVQIVITLIQSRLASHHDFAAVAARVNLSPSRLRHLFKQETGCSLGQYQKQLRLQEAQILLLTSFLSVKEICQKVGFTNRSHFVHDFKKAYGLAPNDYRSLSKRDF